MKIVGRKTILVCFLFSSHVHRNNTFSNTLIPTRYLFVGFTILGMSLIKCMIKSTWFSGIHVNFTKQSILNVLEIALLVCKWIHYNQNITQSLQWVSWNHWIKIRQSTFLDSFLSPIWRGWNMNRLIFIKWWSLECNDHWYLDSRELGP